MTREWWTPKEIAEHYRIGLRTVYDLIEAKKLVPHRFGAGNRGIRISNEDRLAWEETARSTKSKRSRKKRITSNYIPKILKVN